MAGDDEALPIQANARVLGATVKEGETAQYRPQRLRHVYMVPATGKIAVNGVTAEARDGVAIEDEAVLAVKALEDSEIVLVDTQ